MGTNRTATFQIKITANAEMEMSPALDECYSHDNDEHYINLVAVADAIQNGRKVKGGTMISLDTEEAIRALRDEASFRSGACFDQAQDAWDNAERMTYFAMKRSFDSIVKKCDAVLPAGTPTPKKVEAAPQPELPVVKIPEFGPVAVPYYRSNGEVWWQAKVITRSGYSTPLGDCPTQGEALSRAMVWWFKSER